MYEKEQLYLASLVSKGAMNSIIAMGIRAHEKWNRRSVRVIHHSIGVVGRGLRFVMTKKCSPQVEKDTEKGVDQGHR